ncbi:cobaltochelatase subunit CobN [Schlesneria sp. T3-172]|uniref:cobaltochelatase subunit CobN n=1 Tax=Schlesneria sphaerica TaxID=3373610 RepID=UPI0037CAE5CB
MSDAPSDGKPFDRSWTQFAAGGFLVTLFLSAGIWFGLEVRSRPAPRSVSILIICSDPAVESLNRGIDRLLSSDPGLAREVSFQVRSPGNTVADAEVPQTDLLLVELLEAKWVTANEPIIQESHARTRLAFGPSGPAINESTLTQFGLKQDDLVEPYWSEGGPSDVEQMLRLVLKRYAGYLDLEVAPPVKRPEQGYVAWIEGEPRLVETWSEWQVLTKFDPTRPSVAILDFATRARREVLAVPKAIADACQQQGIQPVVCFGQPASKAIRQLLLDEAGKPRIDAIISLHLKFTDKEAEATLSQLDVPIINAIRIYGRTVDEWRDSSQGLTTGEVAWQLAVPELLGLAPHNVVAGLEPTRSGVEAQPIAERVTRVAARARALSELRRTPPAESRVALMYWNYPPGKQNVGASYLNVVRSIPVMLQSMRDAGYQVENFSDAVEIEKRVVDRGRNIARWAPGELERLIDAGGVVTIPVSTYQTWFDALPRRFRDDVTKHWGRPETADIMTTRLGGELHLVLPTIELGNIVLLVQPDRGRTQDLAALYQTQDLPPHHQYIAAYLWLQKEFKAHAVIHTGTHGTHEWLSGKESGLAGFDAGEVLAGDLPILYPYIMDDIGEGIVAKRRGAATIIDHLTPALGTSSLPPELQSLKELIQRWRDARATGGETVAQAQASIDAEVVLRGLDKDLADRGWSEADRSHPDAERRISTLEDYLEQIQAQSIPFGMHTFGVSPIDERLNGFVDLIREAHDEKTASTGRQNLTDSGPAELAALLHGLGGGYIRPGPGNDPVRNPAALPTGRDFYAFDPRTIPAVTAETLGNQLAARLVDEFHSSEGQWPKKFALQVWGVETIRHAGVQEAQALALVGVRAKRDKQGRVSGLELIPREELGRPRVDVVMHGTSLYRDTFPVLVELFDQAVQLAADSPETDNPIRAHIEQLTAELVAGGMSGDEARTRARIRFFAEPSGMHDSKLAAMASASGSWDTEDQVADNYIRRMGHGYGQGTWGQSMETEFRAALAGTQRIVHTRSSKLYATLDNDDYFGYGGSIALGVRRVDGGKSPPMLVTDLRTPGRERHEPIERFLGQEFRSRLLNPEYIKGMQQEGYAGAREVWKSTEYLWGWQVVYPETVGPQKWQELHEVWLKDRYDLKLEDFFHAHNPHAREGMAGRLLEVVRKGYWDPDQKTREELAEIYVTSVVENGVACDTLTCDNPELQTFTKGIAETADGLDPELIAQWLRQVETATGKQLEQRLTERQTDKAAWHDPANRDKSNDGSSPENSQVSGYLMEETQSEIQIQSDPSPVPATPWALILSLTLSPVMTGAVARLKRAG